MLKSLKSNSYRFVVVLLLLLTFLTTDMVGKVIPSYALAQEITPELEPVYDTEVVSLQDYVDNILTDAQVAVFNTILGSYVASQAGLNEYDLEYPYTERTGVIGWLQDAGMKLYNAIITGGSFDLVTGTDLRTYIVTAASYAIGMAQKAHTYTDMDDFLNDIDNSDHYFIPYDPILQASINSYFGRSYGLWNWQFDSKPFESNLNWVNQNLGSFVISYNNILNDLNSPYIKANDTRIYNNSYLRENIQLSYPSDWSPVLFLNSSTGLYLIVDSNNPNISTAKRFTLNGVCTKVYTPTSEIDSVINYVGREVYVQGQVNLSSYNAIVDAVRYIYTLNTTSDAQFKVSYSDLCKHTYVGTSWGDKQEIFNLTDLNFEQNDSPSYNQVPDNSYIDLKGFLTDIVNNTNILNVILNNLFKPDGTLNVDPALIKVSITIPDTNPLPVNLNDIQLYTDNEYLEVVKQRSLQASETIGEYVAFWHNCDAELVYAILGSFIVILIGAFIGKWGHS